MPGWINADLDPAPGGVKWDLTRPIPEPDNSIDFIFNEHFIEHLTREQGVRFLADCRRALRVGGVLRIVTPHLAALLSDYRAGILDRYVPTWRPNTPCQMVNEGMRLWGHQFLYDWEEMSMVLRESGFQFFDQVEYGKSKFSDLIGIDQRPQSFAELIVEATKL